MASDVEQVDNQFILDLYNEADGDGLKWNNDELLMIRTSAAHPSRVFMSGQPFQQTDTFVSMMMEGEFDCIVNLRQRHLEAGDLLLVTPQSILQAVGDVGQFQMQALHLSGTLTDRIFGGNVPALYQLHMSDVLLHPAATDKELALSMLNTLWVAVHTPHTQCRDTELRNLLQLIASMAEQQREQAVSGQPRNVQFFNRFIQLVNSHCEQHRDLDYYANLLCLSKQYLSSIITQVSHHNASWWIEQAVITRAKVLLRHHDLPVQEIAYRLGFTEASNLTRYFKRVTGVTPLDYRNGQSDYNSQ